MTTEVKAFGPSAIATPANAVSLARLVAAPVFAIAVVRLGPASWLLWALWIGLASSDGLDGHIARWHGTTRSGAFLDPLADKFLVLGALAALADLGAVSWVPVVVIAIREAAISGLRISAAGRGVSIPARPSAKLKTVVQDFAVGFVFFPPVGSHHVSIAQDLLWLAVALTVVTGAQYGLDARALLRGSDRPDAPASRQSVG